MPIDRLLQDAAFPPERVDQIAAAYKQTCQLLGLADRDDPLMTLVARKVIEIASSGEQNSQAIALRAVRELLGQLD